MALESPINVNTVAPKKRLQQYRFMGFHQGPKPAGNRNLLFFRDELFRGEQEYQYPRPFFLEISHQVLCGFYHPPDPCILFWFWTPCKSPRNVEGLPSPLCVQ